jgi:hypothetical protein
MALPFQTLGHSTRSIAEFVDLSPDFQAGRDELILLACVISHGISQELLRAWCAMLMAHHGLGGFQIAQA